MKQPAIMSFRARILCAVFVLMSISLVAAFAQTKKSADNKQPANATTAPAKKSKQTPAKVAEKPPVERPKYVIAVTHGGRPLGNIVVELFPDVAPKHVRNFDSLVSAKAYNGTAFHRVIAGFMIQGGDLNTKDPNKPKEMWGMGDPSQAKVPAEFSAVPHKRGIISAARTQDPNSATSQFFICHADAPQLNNQYTVFGQVVSGLELIDSIVKVKTEFVAAEGTYSRPVEKVEMTITRKSQYVISVKQGKKPLGDITIETLPEVAPKHAANFDSLVSVKFYDSTAFHRIIPNFMIQGGDPNSKSKPKEMWGIGDPTQTRVPAEFNKLNHIRGMISAARTQDPNSATSQFFICHGSPTQLDGQYTIFAQVVSGIEVVDKIVALPCGQGGDGAMSAPLEKVEMTIRRK